MMDVLDGVDFNNIPAPLNPNERIVYFNNPPLKIELGDVRKSKTNSFSLSLSNLFFLSFFLLS